ncbi:MAG: Asp23/Gls24 family envelope stress response protein [Anaerolineae bacterium]
MVGEGKVEVAPRAVAVVVAEAVSDCYGVVGMASRTLGEAILTALRRPPATKGISVHLGDNLIIVNVYVIIEYGTRIATVANNVISAVRFRLEQALGTSAFQVNIFVQNVRVSGRNP